MAEDDASGAVVGIDLGTSNTVVGHVEQGHARALADDTTNEVLIPSIASFHPSGTVLVGVPAKDRRIIDSKNTVFSAKRLIGRAWSSPVIAQARARLPYELREGKNQSVQVLARGKLYTLPEISAFVLRKAKAIAEMALGRPVKRAVITCPANFDELQREATKLAGRLAGLDVLRILSEPTAAALAYGYGKSQEERILVYDFGGGTFDVTILSFSAGVFRVRATAGDMYLGGDDIDYAVAQRIAEAFTRRHYYDPRGDKDVFEHVRVAAEQIKMKLSTDAQAAVELNDVMFGPGGKSLAMTFPMSRAELDAIVEPFVERTLKVCARALELAKLRPRDFDQIILVGGSTRIARVRDRVADYFGREPAADISPDEAVAIGAAIQGMAMTEHAASRAAPDAEAPTEEARQRAREVTVDRKPPPPRAHVSALATPLAMSLPTPPTATIPPGSPRPPASASASARAPASASASASAPARAPAPAAPSAAPAPPRAPARVRPPAPPPAKNAHPLVLILAALLLCLGLLIGLGFLLRALS